MFFQKSSNKSSYTAAKWKSGKPRSPPLVRTDARANRRKTAASDDCFHDFFWRRKMVQTSVRRSNAGNYGLRVSLMFYIGPPGGNQPTAEQIAPYLQHMTIFFTICFLTEPGGQLALSYLGAHLSAQSVGTITRTPKSSYICSI